MSVWVCEDLYASLRSLACGCLAYSVSVSVYESMSVSFSACHSLALAGVRKLESLEKSQRVSVSISVSLRASLCFAALARTSL